MNISQCVNLNSKLDSDVIIHVILQLMSVNHNLKL